VSASASESSSPAAAARNGGAPDRGGGAHGVRAPLQRQARPARRQPPAQRAPLHVRPLSFPLSVHLLPMRLAKLVFLHLPLSYALGFESLVTVQIEPMAILSQEKSAKCVVIVAVGGG
jgi:hypothetical protein